MIVMNENTRTTQVAQSGETAHGRRTAVNAGGNSRRTEVNAGGSSRRTEVNAGGNSRLTEVNAGGNSRLTEVNLENVGRSTSVNEGNSAQTAEHTDAGQAREYTAGQKISDYTVLSILNPSQKTGEAVLYLCTDPKGNQVVVKYYNRTDVDVEGKRKLADILNQMKNMQKTLDLGVDGGHFFEVMPYYKNGSLRDRMKRKLFTEKEIVDEILPRMVDMLECLHKAAVYHSDIKPENIMYAENGKDLILIDFGVSVITSGSNNTTILTEVGGTADYRAPETLRGVLIDASDYYSLGITLFTLMAGSTPTDYLREQKDVERAQLLSAVPHINGMSDRMYQLIDGLTYPDIRYRHDRSKLNRWIAQDVRDWLAGKKDQASKAMPIPEEVLIRDLDLNIRFRNRPYQHWQDLLLEMAKNWNPGKQFLMNPGIDSLPNMVFQIYSAERADLERKSALGRLYKNLTGFLEKKRVNDDSAFFDFLYSFSGGEYGWGFQIIFWKGMSFAGLEALGESVYRAALNNHQECFQQFEGLFDSDYLLERYFDQMPEKNEKTDAVQRNLHRILKNPQSKANLKMMMDCCFVLRNEPSLDILPNKRVKTLEEFKRLVMQQGKTPKNLQQMYQSLLDDRQGMLTILNSWLNYHGVSSLRL